MYLLVISLINYYSIKVESRLKEFDSQINDLEKKVGVLTDQVVGQSQASQEKK